MDTNLYRLAQVSIFICDSIYGKWRYKAFMTDMLIYIQKNSASQKGKQIYPKKNPTPKAYFNKYIYNFHIFWPLGRQESAGFNYI